MFSISVYSSEVLHLAEASLECADYVKSNGKEWSFDIGTYYTCSVVASWCSSSSDCSSYSYYLGDGLTANEACVDCGGGICDPTAVEGSESGVYEFSKPTYYCTS